jgi:hypothetical protein
MNASADQVVLKNGDRVTGSIIKKGGKNLTIKTDSFGVVTTSWDQVGSGNGHHAGKCRAVGREDGSGHTRHHERESRGGDRGHEANRGTGRSGNHSER